MMVDSLLHKAYFFKSYSKADVEGNVFFTYGFKVWNIFGIFNPNLGEIRSNLMVAYFSDWVKKRNTERNFVQGLMFDESSRCPMSNSRDDWVYP